MPLTTAFLTTCRAKVDTLDELSAFRTAGALTNDTRSERIARWGRVHATTDSNGTTVGYRLSKAIRDTVNAEADKYQAAGSGVINNNERESAYGTILGEYMPVIDRPTTNADEIAALTTAINNGIMS